MQEVSRIRKCKYKCMTIGYAVTADTAASAIAAGAIVAVSDGIVHLPDLLGGGLAVQMQ